MATVGWTVTGLDANTKALKVGTMIVLAHGMTAQQIVNALADDSTLRPAATGTLQDSIAVDDGA